MRYYPGICNINLTSQIWLSSDFLSISLSFHIFSTYIVYYLIYENLLFVFFVIKKYYGKYFLK